MQNQADFAKKREEKIAQLAKQKDERILAYTDKCRAKCEEDLAKLVQGDKSDVLFQMNKASVREHYNQELISYKKKQEKKFARDIKRLEKKDKRHFARLNRIWEVDFLRGVIIIGMIVDHLVYDFTSGGVFQMSSIFEYPEGQFFETLKFIMNFASGYWEGNFRLFLRVLGVVLLVFLCGLSSALSKNNFKRGGIIMGAGIFVTVALTIFGRITNNHTFGLIMSTLTTLGFLIIFYNGTKLIYMLIERKLYKRSRKENRKVSSWKWVALAVAIGVFLFWIAFRSMPELTDYNRFGRTLFDPYTGGTSYVINNRFMDKDTMPEWWYNFLTFFLVHDEQNYFFNFFFLFNNEGHYCVYQYIDPNKLTFIDYVAIISGAKGYGVDWLGIFPMMGHIFLGGFIGEILYKDKKSLIYLFFKKENRFASDPLTTTPGKINAILNNATCFINYPGQKTLWVYILHQPVIIVLIALIFLMFGTRIILPI